MRWSSPVWMADEFQILLEAPDLAPEALAQRLPGRPPCSIAWVRYAIHEFHSRNDATLLSEGMRRELERRRGQLTCAECKQVF